MLFLYVQIDYAVGTPDNVKEEIAQFLRLYWFEFDVWEYSDTVVPFLELSLEEVSNIIEVVRERLSKPELNKWLDSVEVMLVTHKEKIK